MKSLSDIKQKIKEGTATVLTAKEFKQRVLEGEKFSTEDVDVVTTGTFGIMSGTMGVFNFPFMPPNTFERARAVFMNGIPAFPGPCPNERLGEIDAVVYGTSFRDHSYGGGHLFRDLVEGKPVHITVDTGEKILESEVTLEEMKYSVLQTTRAAFKNYHAMVNPDSTEVRTIFSVTGLKGPLKEASVSGCGSINPLENDPDFHVIGVGTPVLFNGSAGFVMGTGTRSSKKKPNISTFADMKKMDPTLMGGFVTSHGPECLVSIGIPIPVIDEKTLNSLMIQNSGSVLPVTDIRTRTPVGETDYSRIWDKTDLMVRYNKEQCINCEHCKARLLCPTNAITEGHEINRHYCVNCGTCVNNCPEHVFNAELGQIALGNELIPVTLRQSDRSRAERVCGILKRRIIEGKFKLNEMIKRIE